MRVAVLTGGRSSEHEVSLASGASVMKGLEEAGHEVVEVRIARDGGWSSGGEAVALVPGGGLLGADVAFPVLHGAFGEDGSLQGLLELLDLPYVGSDVLSSATCMDKLTLKRLLAGRGIPQVDFVAVGEDGWRARCAELGTPLWVKPSRMGSSVGITRVTDWADLPDALAAAFEHDSKALVEAAVTGREIECGVLEDEYGRPEASVPAEIRVLRGHDWYDFEAKYLDDACEFDVPAALPPDVTDRVRDIACRAFTALDCAGLARVDFFVTADGHVVVNEVNTMPGFTPISMFPRVWAASGVDYPTLVDRLIAAALRRGAA